MSMAVMDYYVHTITHYINCFLLFTQSIPDISYLLHIKYHSNTVKSRFDDQSAQRAFLDGLAQNLRITDENGWYKCTRIKLIQYGGHELLQKYNNSLSNLLEAVYPEYLDTSYFDFLYSVYFLKYKWDVTKFSQIPKQHWNTFSNQRSFLDALAKKLYINDQSDWYKIKKTTLLHQGAKGLLQRYGGSLFNLMKTVYPEYHTSYDEFSSFQERSGENQISNGRRKN